MTAEHSAESSASRPGSARSPLQEIRAAGGVVLREGEDGPEVAVVHRPKYDDWSLPKGKLDLGEGWQDAALREVEEETGLECDLGAELSPITYLDRKGREKLVRWWLMRPRGGQFSASDEIDEMRWLGTAEVDSVLDYEHDRDLVREALAAASG